MAIFTGSRYVSTNLIAIIEESRSRVLFEDREPLSIDDFAGQPLQHTVKRGDQIDALAGRYYGQERLWWLIADVNDLIFPMELVEGSVLLIPPREFARRF